MANAPDTLVETGPVFQQLPIGQMLVTPSGGTQAQLQNLVNGGTLAQTIAAGSTIPSPLITGVASKSVTNGITASVTQTLAGALALTKAVNVVSTVGTAGDAVKLPPVAINVGLAQECWVINNGASALSIFPNETATAIDSHATAAAGTLTAAHRAVFFQNTASTWVSVASVSAAT
jgi:hypothetical protein